MDDMLTHRIPSPSTAAGLLAALLALAAARPAQACTSLSCPWNSVAPAPGATIPANVPALSLDLTSRWLSLDDIRPSFSLRGPDGAPVAASVTKVGESRLVLTPEAPLAERTTYTIERLEQCKDTSQFSKNPSLVTTTFTTSEIAPLPQKSGVLAVQGESHGKAVLPSIAGGCTATGAAHIVELTFTPDPALVPWMSTVHLSTTVDGEPWATEAPGPHVDTAGLPSLTKRFDRIFVLCEPAPKGAESPLSLAPGAHTIAVSAELAGLAQTIPGEAISFEFTCPKSATGAGGQAGGAPASGNSSLPAPADTASHCAASPNALAGATSVHLAALAVLAAQGLRRRARHRPSA